MANTASILPDPAPASEFVPTEYVVSFPLRVGKDNLVILYDTKGDPKLLKPISFKRSKSNDNLRPGQLYRIPTKVEGDNRSLQFTARVWVGEYEDKEKVLAWQGRAKAAEIEEAARKAEEKHGTSTSALEPLFDKLAHAYARVPFPQRLGFEIYVLNRIRQLAKEKT